jgi:hypothetical protein
MHEQLVAVVMVLGLVVAFLLVAFVLGSVAWLVVNA